MRVRIPAGGAATLGAALTAGIAVAAADNPLDGDALYDQLAGPHHDALVRRLQAASQAGNLRGDADLEAVADAIIGATLYPILTHVRTVEETTRHFDGLVDALMGGCGRESRNPVSRRTDRGASGVARPTPT